MAMSYKSRRVWSLVILLVGLPIYIVISSSVVTMLGRPGVLVELFVYVGLGMVWILPFKPIFLGIGQPDPDKEKNPEER